MIDFNIRDLKIDNLHKNDHNGESKWILCWRANVNKYWSVLQLIKKQGLWALKAIHCICVFLDLIYCWEKAMMKIEVTFNLLLDGEYNDEEKPPNCHYYSGLSFLLQTSNTMN